MTEKYFRKIFKVKNPDFTIEARKMDDMELYEIIVDGDIYSNYIGEDEMYTILAAMLYKRNYKEVKKYG